ncbi:tetratricopeptide repeat protein [Sphingobium phenoxybenzoativorans]|uniref:Tetratricopeptide repeat protein n=1 Tax=Sphingobium phenoxybenzoativorans TaxID=1592790 RepID=A0A975Q3Q6_9SPHN|nr:tetratricopeptide repeat protein [Sphingobium phenoxybenzoativorans]QUT07991.1 tetratricopeptide repeat protein [Sphingobium phenoxybenzoativorans]
MRKVHASLFAVAAFLSGSFASEAHFSQAALTALDPLRAASSLCGSRKGQAAFRQRLMLAALAVEPASGVSAPMPLYPDLGVSRFPVSTDNVQARAYFNQGLMLTYGFNHAGAVRSFREAQRIDPGCALCWWGEALALGPNINAAMDERDKDMALAAIDRARGLSGKASPAEQALIAAMALRYSRDPGAERAALDGAYADAMIDVAKLYPDQDDVAVLAAEAVMDTTPWNYWEADKITPVGRSGEAVRLIEQVLARDPDHAQAAHLYVHLMENSGDPKRAEAAADRLSAAPVPSAGHLVHMPAHIYQLRGRYADSMRVNVAAARADEAFIRDTGDRGLVRYGYYPHNIHFIVMSAQMTGDMRTAVREAQRLRTVLDPATSAKIAWIQAIDAAPFLAMAQFAPPKKILAMPAPDSRLPYATAMRHYARAVAYAQLRNGRAFDAELSALAKLRASDAFADMIAQGVPAPDLLSLAEAVARGRFAFAQGRYGEAAGHYRAAIVLEGKIPYQEPPYWYYPVSQSLGAALLRDGKPQEAAQAFRTALAQTPANGWAVYGLAEAEKAQGHELEAAAARQSLQKLWMGDPGWLRVDRL